MRVSYSQVSSTEADKLEGDPVYRDRLIALLQDDLDFHDESSCYSSHNFHSFPAKFPPQLPRRFILELTNPGEVVLDPMMGSGTTIVEAFLAGRRGLGLDIDPLALLLTKVKITPLNMQHVIRSGQTLLSRARKKADRHGKQLLQALDRDSDPKTRDFINYWFAKRTQVELQALITEITGIRDERIRSFFRLAFSSIIITKSGGVSLALDLAHTRPHRAKFLLSETGGYGPEGHRANKVTPRDRFLTKTLRSALDEFEKRYLRNLRDLPISLPIEVPPMVLCGDAQIMPIGDETVDLIVTSPPYASNAIDYMRAHKFSLVWMGHPIDALGQKRKGYIGGETVTDIVLEELPESVMKVVADITSRDRKKGQALHRYYSEMTRVLRESLRVLKPGKAAIFVVGNSVLRGRDTETPTCLADIGRALGFQVPTIGLRNLDRNRRMMPAGARIDSSSQIQQRMHEEYVIGFHKPGK